MDEKQLNLESNSEDFGSALEKYEKLMTDLEEALKIVQDDKSNLADLIKAYEQGIKAHHDCVRILDNVEQRITKITNENQTI